MPATPTRPPARLPHTRADGGREIRHGSRKYAHGHADTQDAERGIRLATAQCGCTNAMSPLTSGGAKTRVRTQRGTRRHSSGAPTLNDHEPDATCFAPRHRKSQFLVIIIRRFQLRSVLSTVPYLPLSGAVVPSLLPPSVARGCVRTAQVRMQAQSAVIRISTCSSGQPARAGANPCPPPPPPPGPRPCHGADFACLRFRHVCSRNRYHMDTACC